MPFMTGKSSSRKKATTDKATADQGSTASTADGAAEPGLEDLDFEAALAELDTVVARMESGDLSLEDSLAAFERGIRLTRHCQSALQNAELRVKQLTADGQLADFAELDDDGAAGSRDD